MKAKKCRQDVEGRLQAAKVAYEAEITKLEGEKEAQRTELFTAQKELKSSGACLKEAIRKNKEPDKELGRVRSRWESANSKLTDELNKVKERLKDTLDKLGSTEAKRKQAEERAAQCEEIANKAIDDIRGGVEARMDLARQEVKSDTCSAFLYTL